MDKPKNLKFISIKEMSKTNNSFAKLSQFNKIKPMNTSRNNFQNLEKFKNAFNENSYSSNFKTISPSKTFFTQTIDTNYTNKTNYHKPTKSFISPFKNNSLNEKILLVNENKKKLLKKKEEEFIEKYNEKEKRFQKIREKILEKKLFISNKVNKLNDMRRLRLKIHNIISNQEKNICEEFESKSLGFNIKMIDYLSGKHNLSQSIKYQSTFRFDKIENGEAHDRYKMLIDIDNMKINEGISDKILENELDLDEKKLIIEDPDYFFHNNVSDKFKSISLVERIQQEEEINHGNKNLPLLNHTFNNKKHKKKHLLSNKNNIYQRLNDIKYDINKTIYNKKTKELNFREDEKSQKNKIVSSMIKNLNEMFVKNLKKELNDNKDKREKMYITLNPNNIQFIKRKKSIYDFNKEKTKFNFNAFNKEELELLKTLKKKIKDSYE